MKKLKLSPKLHSKCSTEVHSLPSPNTQPLLPFLRCSFVCLTQPVALQQLQPHSCPLRVLALALFRLQSAACTYFQAELDVEAHSPRCISPTGYKAAVFALQSPPLSIILAIHSPPRLGHFLSRLNLCLEHPSSLLHLQRMRYVGLSIAPSRYPSLTPPVPCWALPFVPVALGICPPTSITLYCCCLFNCLPPLFSHLLTLSSYLRPKAFSSSLPRYPLHPAQCLEQSRPH